MTYKKNPVKTAITTQPPATFAKVNRYEINSFSVTEPGSVSAFVKYHKSSPNHSLILTSNCT